MTNDSGAASWIDEETFLPRMAHGRLVALGKRVFNHIGDYREESMQLENIGITFPRWQDSYPEVDQRAHGGGGYATVEEFDAWFGKNVLPLHVDEEEVRPEYLAAFYAWRGNGRQALNGWFQDLDGAHEGMIDRINAEQGRWLIWFLNGVFLTRIARGLLNAWGLDNAGQYVTHAA